MIDASEALRTITTLETKLHAAETRAKELDAACAAMRGALERILAGINARWNDLGDRPTSPPAWVLGFQSIVEGALSSTAGSALLERLEAYREGFEAWEHYDDERFGHECDAHCRGQSEEPMSSAEARLIAARNRIAQLKGGA